MDTFVRDFDEALLSDLECPVCTEYMLPPITLCCNGHNICNDCRRNVECCPTCRGQLSAIRNVTLENIARRQQYPCVNRDKGCTEDKHIEQTCISMDIPTLSGDIKPTKVFGMDIIREHQVLCKYGPIKCPLNKFATVKCLWKGPFSDFKEHVREHHNDYYRDTPYIRSHTVGNGEAVRFLFNEAFLCCKRLRENKLYCVVQLVGTKEEASKFKSQFTLCGKNGIDKIVQTFVVRSFAEDFFESFRSGKCLILDDKVMKNFITDGKLNLIVSVTRVEKAPVTPE